MKNVDTSRTPVPGLASSVPAAEQIASIVRDCFGCVDLMGVGQKEGAYTSAIQHCISIYIWSENVKGSL